MCSPDPSLHHSLLPSPQDLSEEKCEWDETLEKIKLLQKFAPDAGPIPMEIFDSDVRLVKQGWSSLTTSYMYILLSLYDVWVAYMYICVQVDSVVTIRIHLILIHTM